MKLLYMFMATALIILAVISFVTGDLENVEFCCIMSILIMIYGQILERR